MEVRNVYKEANAKRTGIIAYRGKKKSKGKKETQWKGRKGIE
jgi:hypothetical protein